MSENYAVPIKFAHVVLKARNYEKQVGFYQTLLGGHVVFQDQNSTALTYDDEHHRILIAKFPGLLPRIKAMAGIDHYAYTYESLAGLLQTYKRMKKNGHTPVWCTHHGPTISIYYEDPDTNVVETQVDVFETIEEVNKYQASDDFQTNPLGVDFDPDALSQRLESGETWEQLRFRTPSGPRHPATLPRRYLGWFHWTVLQIMRKLGGRE